MDGILAQFLCAIAPAIFVCGVAVGVRLEKLYLYRVHNRHYR